MNSTEQKLVLDFGQRYVIVWNEDGRLHRIVAQYLGELDGDFWGFLLLRERTRIMVRKEAVLKLEEVSDGGGARP